MQSERVLDSNQENGFINRPHIEWEWDIEVYTREVPFPRQLEEEDTIVNITYIPLSKL